MASCLGEVHIWTLKNQTNIADNDIGCFSYHDKNEAETSAEHLYLEEKSSYTEGRNVTWTPRNKRPEKLKDTLRDVEDLMTQFKAVSIRWLSRKLIQMVLTNGTVITLLVSIHTGDVDRVFIDKTFVGKLFSENPSDVLITENYMVVAHPDKTKLDFIAFTKKPSNDAVKRFDKMASYDPKISQVDLPGPVGRKLDRRLACNLHQDYVLCWWPTASEDAWPWSPMSGERERANMVLYGATGQRFDLISFIRTDCDPIGISYSLIHPSKLFTIEQSVGSRSNINVSACVYDCHRSKMQRLAITSIPLKTNVLCYNRNLTEDKVVLGCEDKSLVLYDEYRKITQMTTANLVPCQVKWHHSGTVIVVVSQVGDIQVFDLALAPLMFQLVSEEPSPGVTLQLSQYFRNSPHVSSIMWSPLVEQPESRLPECNDSVFIMFNRGPMVLLQFYLGVMSQGNLSPLSLVNEYIKHQKVDDALNILGALNWNAESQICFASLSNIINHLLQRTLNADREAQLETALGTFYAPNRPLNEVTVLEYRDPISFLARRFFHHLLRYCRFEKAYLLAVDIGSRDLFMDIHYLAKDKGETALAEVARRKADLVESASVGTGSVDEDELSGESDSLDDSYSGSDEEFLGNPPPRPPKYMAATVGGMGRAVRPPPPPPPPRQQSSTYQNLPQYDPRFDPQRQAVAHASAQGAQRDPWLQEPYTGISESALHNLEANLANQLEEEYTETLMEEPILPPPLSHADEDQRGDQGDHSTTTVKVIHFGIV